MTKGTVADGVITPDVLYALGVASKRRMPIKILGNGDLGSKLTVTAHAFSATAKQKIEAAGGTATTVTA